MKVVSIILIILCCSSFFHSSAEEISGSIVNGDDASIQDYPYMAKVWVTLYAMCGGSILSTRSVLTTAHCFIDILLQPGFTSVTVGSSFRDGRLGGRRYRVLRTFIHPNYLLNDTVLVNDVAVIRTFSEIQFNRRVQPIQLYTGNDILPGTHGIFTGWGFIEQGRFLPTWADRLQKMDAVTMSNDDCYDKLSFHSRAQWINEQNVCVLSRPGTSACGGDSGSPLVIDNQVAAIISWRLRSCGDGTPDVFVLISAVHEWIESVL